MNDLTDFPYSQTLWRKVETHREHVKVTNAFLHVFHAPEPLILALHCVCRRVSQTCVDSKDEFQFKHSLSSSWHKLSVHAD
jgi:hypothetical protein